MDNAVYLDNPLQPLTKRELEILQLVSDGCTDQEIGTRLFLSTDTVKWHTKNIYSKLDVHHRTAAVARGRALGLLQLDADVLLFSLPVQRHNLPHKFTGFIGRDADKTQILARLTDPACRVLTLVGIGGIGKTSLAIQCASEVLDSFIDGVFFVGLDAALSSDALVSGIADALHLQTNDQDQLRIRLLSLLRYKKMLLVLDGFEHLVSESGFISNLIYAVPGLKILVTSREILDLNEEWVYQVTGLAVPDMSDAEAFEDYDATRLFVERARRVRKDFDPYAERIWITQICHAVGGMPLAIELLTTWLSVLTCQEIAGELARNSDLLAATRRDLPERQQSIRAVFEQSWRFLGAEEQAVFMRLAVFSGGFTREAAEYIAGVSLPVLIALVNKSLITSVWEGRYELHALVRQFAEEKLTQDSEQEARTRHLHSQYYAKHLLQEKHTVVWKDADNTLAGARFAAEQRDFELIAAYAGGFWSRFEDNAERRLEEGFIDFFRNSIAVIQEDTHQTGKSPVSITVQAQLYESLGNLLHSAAQYDETGLTYQKALSHTSDEDIYLRARLLRKIGSAALAKRSKNELILNNYQAALNALGTAPSEDQLRWWREWLHIQLDISWLYYVRSDINALSQQIEEIEPVISVYGTPAQQSKFFHTQALFDMRRWQFHNLPDQTLGFAIDALEAAREANDTRQIIWLTFGLGFTYLWRNEFDEAEQQFDAAQKLIEQFGDSFGARVTTLAYFPIIYRRKQQIEEVELRAQEGLNAATETKAIVYAAASQGHLGWAAYRRGDLSAARQWCEAALEQWAKSEFPYPFQWMARVPLLAVEFEAKRYSQAVEQIRFLLNPSQQPLLFDLPDLLNQALNAWENQQLESFQNNMNTFCQSARQLGYL